MKKLPLFLILLICIASCNTNSKTKIVDGEKQKTSDTVFNAKIQGVFFDTPFGSSKAEVIKNFKNHGLRFINYTSTETLLHFSPQRGKYFSFGNMSWEMVDVEVSNDKFYFIRFMNTSEDKATTIQAYENLLATVSAKYEMMEETPEDTMIYRVAAGYTESIPHRVVIVSCFKYETISRKMLQGISLEYADGKFYEDEVSDEL
ncbi:MAG: hypothetical protein IJ190_06345 [Prevotella sp.]|nr:hypothetical protein [Prevotella sp.]